MTPRPHVAFLTYNGLLEPLGLRQGLEYLEPLADEFDLSVLSFEKVTRDREPARWSAMETRLSTAGIGWIPLRYHARPTLPATAWDVWMGVRATAALHARKPLHLLHARGYVSAAMARRAGESLGLPYLFDIRGLLADEYVDGGVWRKGSLPWRVTMAEERRLLRDAAGLVTLTESIKPEVARRRTEAGAPVDGLPWAVIPCCVNLRDFHPRPEVREDTRRRLGMGRGPTLVYAGSVGTWYPTRPMVTFAAEMGARVPGLQVLLLLNGAEGPVLDAFAAGGVARDSVTVVRARPEEVPIHLAAADLGMAFIQPSASKRASSPTKVAEYLASGLPVVVNAGVGDLDALADERSVVVAKGLRDDEVRAAAAACVPLLGMDPGIPRELASRAFDLHGFGAPRYRALYRTLTDRSAPA